MSDIDAHAQHGPAQPRLLLIDSLRGTALFGVLLINMLWFAGQDNAVSREQFAYLPGASWHDRADYLISIFVFAKSIGVFAFLFGFGFAQQMRSFESRGIAAIATYRRRILALLALGLLHWMACWSGDILHAYAIAGLLLLLVRRWRSSSLLVAGLLLAVTARPVIGRLPSLLGLWSAPPTDLAMRLQTFQFGSFADIVRLQFVNDVLPDFASGALLAAIVHALGRFMVGVAISRGGYLADPAAFRRPLTLIATAGLITGFVAQHDWVMSRWLAHGWLQLSAPATAFAGHLCNSFGVVAMTTGYIALFGRLWIIPPVQRVLRLPAAAGRMALTNYLAQTLVNYWLFCGFGLGLMGRIGIVFCIPLSIAVFGLQMLISSRWLGSHTMGPAEWLWRWWTYGTRPALRIRRSG